MSDMEAEVEEVSFLPGEKILNKKAVYEPSSSQRCRQLVCSRRWAVAILITMVLFLLLIAIIASFARPGSIMCQSHTGQSEASSQGGSGGGSKPASGDGKENTYISTDGRPFPWKNILLPRNVIPDAYEIFLHPNLTTSTFSGSVTVRCTVVNSTDFVVLHIKDLNVTTVRVLRGEVDVKVVDKLECKPNEQLYIQLAADQKLAANSIIHVVVKFESKLVSKLAGFYKSSYKTASGQTREIATTHFEPTDARAAFPCFDEPDLKANFTMSIIREERHISLFNMPLKVSVDVPSLGAGLIQDDYMTSVKMSTYLVAFIVCDFKNVSAHTSDNKTLVRVFAPEDKINQAYYALTVAVKVLDYYNTFFGMPYPLPKQDMIAIPDFSAGAMENWGLITYRMTSILYDKDKTSASGKQWITTVIAHELAHQWFGNIVTMKWWDDLWLNEGFASFVEYIGAGVAEPTFAMEDQFALDTLQRALYLDSFANSHPIQVPVNDPAQINEIFDRISYDKGASLIRMVQEFIGKDKFKEGLHNYLIAHAYSNARTEDLWQSLQEVFVCNAHVQASSLNKSMTVKDVMDTWTLQMGYPVVTVKRQPGTNKVTLTQSRFMLSGESTGAADSKFKSPFSYVWKIPFTYCTGSSQKKEQVWLTEKEMTLPVSLEDGEWIKGNLDSSGFYRVNYDQSLWRLIIEQLKKNMSVFSVQDRAGLLDDVFSLARAGHLSYDIVFELLGYFNRETEYVPMQTAIAGYGYIKGRMYITEVYPKILKYMLGLISSRMNALGWSQQEGHLDKLLQTVLLTSAVENNDENSISKVKEFYKNWTLIPANLRSLVYCMCVHEGKDDVWQNIYKNYMSSNVPTERKQFLLALTYTRDPRRIQLFLRDSLNDSVVKSQDLVTVINGFAGRASSQLFAWRFVQQEWPTLHDRYATASFTLTGLLNSVVAPFNTQFDYDEVTSFFKGKHLGSGKRSLEQSLETVKSHITWLEDHKQSITDWFNKNNPDHLE